LANAKFDLILMDVQMPRMDGYEATAQIRAKEAAGFPQQIIIAVTANALPSDRDLCLEAGMDDYIAKPVTETLLREKISGWVELPTAQKAA